MAISEGPMTIDSLVEEILNAAHGYLRIVESKTSLTSSITNSATSLVVDDINQISKGLVEIEDELVYVTSVNKTTSTVTIAPWGRGQNNSQAVSHNGGVAVTNSPVFPRQSVRQALWGVLRETFPAIAAFGEYVTSVVPVKTNYVLPSDCYDVLNVSWLVPGPTGQWLPARSWRQNKRAGDPVELELLSFAFPGQNRLRVEYMKNPITSFGATDDLGSYGFDLQIRDVLVLGATARLLAYVESSRVLTESVVGSNRTETTPAGAAMSASKSLYQLFLARLESERQQQLLRHPRQIKFTR